MPARGISGTGSLRHGLKTSVPVERLIICSPCYGLGALGRRGYTPTADACLSLCFRGNAGQWRMPNHVRVLLVPDADRAEIISRATPLILEAVGHVHARTVRA